MSSNAGGLIVWPAKLLIPVGFALLILQGLSEIIKRIAFLAGRLDASAFGRQGGSAQVEIDAIKNANPLN
jgi:TRAP-type mannitol/chloroaromatic compound transport system permease small subunit